ncbi:hypothetical protein K501DRAFT_6828 [Backusella circina FSU 941]|nr:hypothetical protein K501DRAFT_6828 [Backusella circina FSU 941]
MTIVIGWFLDNDHDFDTLMVNILIGSVVLFLLSLSTTVNADPDLIMEDERSPLNNARQASFGSTKKKSGSVAYCYTPYRLFREPLSHISEEEDNVVQRVQTTNSTTTRPLPIPPRPESANSNVSTTLSIMTTTNISAAPEHVNSCIYCLPPSMDSNNRVSYFYPSSSSSMYLNNRPEPVWLSSSFDLAQLPCPPLSSSVLTLGLLVPRQYYTNDVENCYPPPNDFEEDDDQEDATRRASRHCFSSFSSSSQQGQWNLNSFLFSFFCTGIAFGMIQTLSLLYMHHVLLLPMHFIGFIGSVMIFSDIIANLWIPHVAERYSPSFVTKFAYISLITTTFFYTWLQPNVLATKVAIAILQCIQGFSFHIIWLLSIRHIDSTIDSNYKRMILKGGVATLCSSLGPALGVMITGYIVNNHSEGYKLVYKYAAGVIALGALSSWEWPILD